MAAIKFSSRLVDASRAYQESCCFYREKLGIPIENGGFSWNIYSGTTKFSRYGKKYTWNVRISQGFSGEIEDLWVADSSGKDFSIRLRGTLYDCNSEWVKSFVEWRLSESPDPKEFAKILDDMKRVVFKEDRANSLNIKEKGRTHNILLHGEKLLLGVTSGGEFFKIKERVSDPKGSKYIMRRIGRKYEEFSAVEAHSHLVPEGSEILYWTFEGMRPGKVLELVRAKYHSKTPQLLLKVKDSDGKIIPVSPNLVAAIIDWKGSGKISKTSKVVI